MDLNILYEDQHIIVCIKPTGVLSQEDETKDPDMLTIIKEHIRVCENKPGNVYLGLVHRLDRMTSGIMVFAKRSKSASRLSKDITDGGFKKSYIALVEGTFKEKVGRLENNILKDEKNLKAIISKDGKNAILEYEVLKEIDCNSLVKVNLITGRYHQIRVQMSYINHPLVGDSLYGSKTQKPIKLHAYHLEFHHPMTNELKVFENYPKWY